MKNRESLPDAWFTSFMLNAWAIASVWMLSVWIVWGSDQPQWGEAWTRNMVSNEKHLPESFDVKTGKHVKWSAALGTQTHSTPIVAHGRVYIGTNNGAPRDSRHQGDRGVLMCFDERTGKFLWQLVVPKREEDPYFDWPEAGISSPATVEGDRVYIVSNRGEVMCLDARGMSNGNDGPYTNEATHFIPHQADNSTATNGTWPNATGPLDADILWLFDLTKGAGIWSHDAAHSSILIHGDYLYLNTGTGVDNTHKRIRTPDAPSLVVLDKRTGRLVAREREEMAPNIFHNTWCSPSMAEVEGRSLVFFGGGNGILYAFDAAIPKGAASGPQTLRKVWAYDFDPDAPKTNVHQFNGNRREGPSNFYGMPVFDNGRIYAAAGGDLWWGKNEAWLKCIDASGTSTNRLIWSYPLQKHVLSTPAIYNGMVFIADCGRKFHCVDAENGQALWTQDVEGEVWASPLVADGKVYLGTRSGAFYIFAAAKDKRLISKSQLEAPVSATATAANGVLYVATMSHLYAVSL
jgi:outer membrane protein assembly factor BamB